MKPALKAEGPDFLRTLLDIRLPEGVGRLWLPVVSTQAKREAAAKRDNGSAAANGFDAKALETALRLKMFQTDALVYKALVHQLLQKIGKGPWSNDPGQFGKQVREVITTAINRGLKLSIDDTSRGSEVTMEEQWDEGNFDPVGEYVESVDGEAAAICETMQRQRAADIANFLLDLPAVPMSDMPVA